jgi:hypothetical protein
MLSCLVYIYVSFKVLVCIVVSRIACMVIAVLWSSYVYLLYGVFVVLCNCCTGCCVFVVLCVLIFLL